MEHKNGDNSMTKNAYQMTGIIVMMVSVFLIIAGLFLKGDTIPAFIAPVSLTSGIVLLVVGIVFYRVLKGE